MKQIELPFEGSEMDKTPSEETLLIAGGIYMYREDDINEMYDGMLAVCFGNDSFHFLFDGISHIENECELALAHRMKHLPGYALAINKTEQNWLIRNSVIKNKPGYILQEGLYAGGFEKSLEPYLKRLQ